MTNAWRRVSVHLCPFEADRSIARSQLTLYMGPGTRCQRPLSGLGFERCMRPRLSCRSRPPAAPAEPIRGAAFRGTVRCSFRLLFGKLTISATRERYDEPTHRATAGR